MKEYKEFLKSKEFFVADHGFTVSGSIVNPKLYDFQKAIVQWAVKKGRCCIFADCGLGKSFMQLEWAKLVGGDCLILAPLTVAPQTVNEGKKIGIAVNICASQEDVKPGINITNYEKLHKFDASKFKAVVLDESSILKSFDGEYRNQIIDRFKHTPFKLACTATPSPNDFMELGNHSEFLGIMSRTEMLSTFFVHDGGDTSQWRLKKHAATEFWRWVCSWAMYLRNPSELGYDGKKFVLPKLNIHKHILRLDKPTEGYLIPMEASSLSERRDARRSSITERVEEAKKLVEGVSKWANQVQNTGDSIMQKTGNSVEPIKGHHITDIKQNGKLPVGCGSKKIQSVIVNGLKNTTIKIKEDISYLAEDTNYGDTDSVKVNSEPLCLSKMDDVQSAEQCQNQIETSTSTTIMRREESEDCSATPVTSCWGDSKTVKENCREVEKQTPQNIYDDQWLIWVNLNDEGDLLENELEAVQVSGSDTDEHKSNSAIKFANGEIKTMISKPRIFGFGLNLQSCHNMIFVGLSDSFEQYYQAVRRCWRFGQKHPVDVHIILSESETAILKNIERKQADHDAMAEEMSKNTKEILNMELHGTVRQTEDYKTDKAEGHGWTMHLGDSCELIKKVESDSVGLSIFSPPFSSLYTYSNSNRDMGNSKTDGEFMEHFTFLVKELYRVIIPGRHVVFHVMNLPVSKQKDGHIGIRDFRGDMIRLFTDVGFYYHSEVCIWKDPVTAMQRTKALGLLHKQIKKDSCMSRMGIPDYVIAMRKPGDNPFRVTHTSDDFPVDLWQKWASPVWDDIDPSDTLQRTSAREHDDERHICPLQLEVIRRCLHLWSKKGDVVLSPFAGIGSEGFESVKSNRTFIGMELKESYYKQACLNLIRAESEQEVELFK